MATPHSQIITLRRQEIILLHKDALPVNIRLDGKRYVEGGIGDGPYPERRVEYVLHRYTCKRADPYWDCYTFVEDIIEGKE